MVRRGDGHSIDLRACIRGRLCGSGVGLAYDWQTGAYPGCRWSCRMSAINLLQAALLLGLYVTLAGSYGIVYAIARLQDAPILQRISFIRLNLWSRLASVAFWWMHAMTASTCRKRCVQSRSRSVARPLGAWIFSDRNPSAIGGARRRWRARRASAIRVLYSAAANC
jgi:hypothetical protein